MTKSVFVNDTRLPGGSKEEIENTYNLSVTLHEDGTLSVEGDAKDVDAYIEDYCIVVEND